MLVGFLQSARSSKFSSCPEQYICFVTQLICQLCGHQDTDGTWWGWLHFQDPNKCKTCLNKKQELKLVVLVSAPFKGLTLSLNCCYFWWWNTKEKEPAPSPRFFLPELFTQQWVYASLLDLLCGEEELWYLKPLCKILLFYIKSKQRCIIS